MLKAVGEGHRLPTPERRKEEESQKEKPKSTYRRLDASEEPASDEAASPGGEFIRLEAGQRLAGCHERGSPTFQFNLAQQARNLGERKPRWDRRPTHALSDALSQRDGALALQEKLHGNGVPEDQPTFLNKPGKLMFQGNNCIVLSLTD